MELALAKVEGADMRSRTHINRNTMVVDERRPRAKRMMEVGWGERYGGQMVECRSRGGRRCFCKRVKERRNGIRVNGIIR